MSVATYKSPPPSGIPALALRMIALLRLGIGIRVALLIVMLLNVTAPIILRRRVERLLPSVSVHLLLLLLEPVVGVVLVAQATLLALVPARVAGSGVGIGGSVAVPEARLADLLSCCRIDRVVASAVGVSRR